VLRKNVAGISSRVLTERLRTLEDKGFVFRHYEPTIPPAVTYGITERMKDIQKVLALLEGLARKWHTEGEKVVPGTSTHSARTATHAYEESERRATVDECSRVSRLREKSL
jgi:DNA-binding HxlR family transcriptional regulator